MRLRPSEAAVLLAISNGIDTVDAIARALNTSRDTVKKIVAELEAKGLIEERQEGKIIKRRRLRLTDYGLDALGEARRQLDSLLEAYRYYRERRTLPPTWQWGFDEFLLVLPLLTVLGIIPAIEITALLSTLNDIDSIEALEEDYDEIDDDWALDE